MKTHLREVKARAGMVNTSLCGVQAHLRVVKTRLHLAGPRLHLARAPTAVAAAQAWDA
jgi:hypothetical protein